VSAGAALALAPVFALDPEIVELLKAKFALHHPRGSEPRPPKFTWRRGDVLPLAWKRCATCHGAGWQTPRSIRGEDPCECVTRRIFRDLMRERTKCLMSAEHISRCKPELSMGGGGRRARWNWCMPKQEFIADLHALALRTLDDEHLRVWRLYHCAGATWREACAILGIAKGDFYHRVYRVEHAIGRAARELMPYPLYPLDEYFSR
jgi:hypothetical protein